MRWTVCSFPSQDLNRTQYAIIKSLHEPPNVFAVATRTVVLLVGRRRPELFTDE